MAEALASTLGGFGLSGSLSTCSSWGGPALWQLPLFLGFSLATAMRAFGLYDSLWFLQGQADHVVGGRKLLSFLDPGLSVTVYCGSTFA